MPDREISRVFHVWNLRKRVEAGGDRRKEQSPVSRGERAS